MPECPWCNGVAKKRKNGRCPGCGNPVEIYHLGRGSNATTVWVAEKPSTKELVDLLEARIACGNPGFTFGSWEDQGYIAQLAAAKTLLDRCGGDQEIAKATIEFYFSGTPGVWPPQNMFGVIGGKFSYAVAWARNRARDERQRREAEDRRFAVAEQRQLDVQYAI